MRVRSVQQMQTPACRTRRALLKNAALAGVLPAAGLGCILQPSERRTSSRPGVLTVAWNVGDVPGGEPAVRQLLEAVAEDTAHPHGPAAAGYRLELERFIAETFAENVLNARAWELRVGAMQHGYGPDLVIGGENFISLLATEGVLLPFDGHGAPALDVRPAEFVPAALEGLRTYGRLVALPLSVTPAVLYYNPKLFFRYGVLPPQREWGWRELLEAAQRLTLDLDTAGNPPKFAGVRSHRLAAPLAPGDLLYSQCPAHLPGAPARIERSPAEAGLPGGCGGNLGHSGACCNRLSCALVDCVQA